MRKIWLYLLVFISLSCQREHSSKELLAKTYLDSAEIFIGERQFQKAVDKASQALEEIKNLESEEAKDPEKFNLLLLKVRAHLLLFSAKNTVLIQNAPVQAKSLVRLAPLNEYKDYEADISTALSLLNSLKAKEKELSLDQQSFVDSSLAFIKRLDRSTASEALDFYHSAIEKLKQLLNERLLEEKRDKEQRGMEKRGVEKKQISPALLAMQIRDLKMQQVEVELLMNDFAQALYHLEEIEAGKDLLFFAAQFKNLDKKILELRERIFKNANSALVPEKLTGAQKQSITPYAISLNHTENELLQLQNNLLYRIICYKQLNSLQELAQAKQILKEFYPDLAANLEALFLQYP